MKAVFFPNWLNALTSSGFPASKIKSYQIAIRWYLSYLKANREAATIESARRFVETAIKERNPEPWMIDCWKDAIRWFFVNAPIRKPLRTSDNRRSEDSFNAQHTPSGRNGQVPAAECADGQPESAFEWMVAARRKLLRVRHRTWDTEKDYLTWIERFLDFHRNCAPPSPLQWVA